MPTIILRAFTVNASQDGSVMNDWFSDDASADDAQGLGRAPLLEQITAALERAERQSASTVFGLVGAWGSGKTSILKWVRDHGVSDRWRVIEFNPWDYQDSEALQIGFLAELANAFPEKGKGDRLRNLVARFGDAIAPLTAPVALAGFDPSKSVSALASMIATNRSVSEERERLVSMLNALDTPVLVLLDDLDRISADELLLTLKLVRQLGRLPHVHYLLAYDERTLLDVLAKTSLVGDSSSERAKAYLEKVVQIRFDIPTIRPTDHLGLMNEGLSSLSELRGFQFSEPDSARLTHVYSRVLAPSLQTPRSIKRFFAQAATVGPGMHAELDPVDYLVVTWLRTMEPTVWSMIQREREHLVGRPPSSSLSRISDADRTQRLQRWQKALALVRGSDAAVEPVAAALCSLFPRFMAEWQQVDLATELTPRGAADDAYFERYFELGLRADDLSDAAVHDAMRFGGEDRRRDPSSALVEIAVRANPGLALSKLAREAERQSIETPAAFSWLASLYEAAASVDDPFSGQRMLENAVATRIRSLPAEPADVALESLSHVGSGRLFFQSLRIAVRARYGDVPQLEMTARRRMLARSTATRVSANWDLTSMDLEYRPLAWAWADLDAEGFTEWLTKSDHPSLHQLTFFVSIHLVRGRPGARPQLSGYNLDDAASFLDFERLGEELASELAEVDPLYASTFEGEADTQANRKRVALTALRDLLASRPASD
ncbi:KAP family NTPase [Agrococcus terreus]|uniref:KAP family P-loop NTPase fold protein n=1 Tax=Agrococcus terreus TaxID=574649 RepID=UPI00384B6C6F